MKPNDQTLLEEAYKEVQTGNTQAVESAIEQFKTAAAAIVELVGKGSITPSASLGTTEEGDATLNSIIQQFTENVNRARRKYTASKVSPETRKAAAQKAKDTNAKWKAESEEWKAKRKGEIRNHEQRLDRGYLPTYLNDSRGTPNPEYYELETIDDDGYSIYSLKDEYDDVRVSDKRVPDSVLWVSSKAPRHSQQTIDRINAKKQASAASAWRAFASR
jgi:hypothetical protein